MDSLKNLLITDSEEVRPNWGTSAEYWLCVLGTFSWSDGDNSIILRLRRWIWKSMAISISYF